MEDRQDYFNYLDSLRESGKTNMFGAAEYLLEEFDLDKKYAGEILVAWMKQYRSKD